jgi:hypothetical protein
MFIHVNNSYLNLREIGSAEPHGEGYTLYRWDGEAIIDVSKEAWHNAVAGSWPIVAASPGFTLLVIEKGIEDGSLKVSEEYPIVGWRTGDLGRAVPVCVGVVREDAVTITAIREPTGKVSVGGVTPFKPLEEAWEMIDALFAGPEPREVQNEDDERD